VFVLRFEDAGRASLDGRSINGRDVVGLQVGAVSNGPAPELERGAPEVPEEGRKAAALMSQSQTSTKGVPTMVRRITITCVALLALLGATDAVAKHHKKPKVAVGVYAGTTSDGIPLTITLDPGRATGSISYCSLTATFTTSGTVRAKSFAVSYTDPNSQDTIVASGFFSAKRRTVSGTMAPNGCDSVPQTYTLPHG
jgi:hypothetical protein